MKIQSIKNKLLSVFDDSYELTNKEKELKNRVECLIEFMNSLDDETFEIHGCDDLYQELIYVYTTFHKEDIINEESS